MKRSMVAVGMVAVAVMLAAGAAQAVVIDTVHVGNAGNAADTTGYGAVDYEYDIGKYEVTAGQYTAFLNSVAKTDTYALYNVKMAYVGTDVNSTGCGITQTVVSGSFVYSVASGFENKPVNWVSWYDTLRFANWLHNGQGSGDTETGAYTLTTSGIDDNTITRNAGWKWAVPTENEWYKAAYHKNDGVTGNYWDYPTGSSTTPTAEEPPGGTNSANYDDAVETTTIVGAYTASESPYGTFDQGGNVWEWNEAVYYSYRGQRGGSFNYFDSSLQSSGSSLGSNYYHPTHECYYIGVRVSQVPEPATLALMGLGGAAALIRRRRK